MRDKNDSSKHALKDLDFSKKDITDLPYEITGLSDLYLLFIQQNPNNEGATETLETMIDFYEGREVLIIETSLIVIG